jgi:hypothetical protein
VISVWENPTLQGLYLEEVVYFLIIDLQEGAVDVEIVALLTCVSADFLE